MYKQSCTQQVQVRTQKFARYSGVSASIRDTVPGSTKGDSCELTVTKNQRAHGARRLGFTPGGLHSGAYRVQGMCMCKQSCTRGYKGTYPNFPRYHFGPPKLDPKTWLIKFLGQNLGKLLGPKKRLVGSRAKPTILAA